MFDVFYTNKKPNIFSHERFARDLDHAASLSRTRLFWFIDGRNDYTGFDWEWTPAPWEDTHVHVWPSQHQRCGDVFLANPDAVKERQWHFRDECTVTRLPDDSCWIARDKIAHWDSSWHPDALEGNYDYHFGSQWYPPQIRTSLIYRMPNSKGIKYIDQLQCTLAPNLNNWHIPAHIPLENTDFDFSWLPSPLDPLYIYEFASRWNKTSGLQYRPEGTEPGVTEVKYLDFQVTPMLASEEHWTVPDNVVKKSVQFSWRPDTTEEPYIYEFPSQWQRASGVRFVVPGATEIKYCDAFTVLAKQTIDNWEIPVNVLPDSFDRSWHPDNTEKPYIYEFATQHQSNGGPRYVVPGATEIKYVDIGARTTDVRTNWKTLHPVSDFDYTWHPDNTEKPYIYVFGNQHWPAEKMPTVEYHVPGATERKFVHDKMAVLVQKKQDWYVPEDLDVGGFDFSWVPDPGNPPYNYVFGTQWAKTGGPEYRMSNAVEVHYVSSMAATALPRLSNWEPVDSLEIAEFDYSWHPDLTDQPYIYVFGNTQYPAEVMPTLRYVVPGAVDIKYVDVIKARLCPSYDNWEIPDNIDRNSFDFSWMPDPGSPAYIYEFGTQWNNRGGPRYVVPGATQYKYVPYPVAKLNPSYENWHILEDIDKKSFNWSWVPHPDDPPYIYVFGNQWYPAERMPTVEYRVPGATERKYINDITVKLLPAKERWDIPVSVSVEHFDFSWRPDPFDPPYIYEAGTQWAKTGGPRYIVEGATETKYLDIKGTLHLHNKDNFVVLEAVDQFDYSWHPDNTEEPYIYVFGNQHWSSEKMPTVEYHVPGATERKYMESPVATLSQNKTLWQQLLPVHEATFDWSWVPDPNDPPYIYVFGNQWNSPEFEPTLEYHVPGSTQRKYVHSPRPSVVADRSHWDVVIPIKESQFDFSWRPNPKEPPYRYVFGNTQYPGTIMPTVYYTVPGATQDKFIDDIEAVLDNNRENWYLLEDINEEAFDFSWVPNPKDPPYIYVFGNQWHPSNVYASVEYRVPGATERKFMDSRAKRSQNRQNWVIPDTVEDLDFDFSWMPDPTSPPYAYQFGTQWAKTNGPLLYVPDSQGVKYENAVVAKAKPRPTDPNWVVLLPVDNFDWSWHPDETEEPYIYVFGNQWNNAVLEPTVEYRVPGATEYKYIDDIVAEVSADMTNWTIEDAIESFDFSWRPHPKDPPYIYVFGNTWLPPEIRPAVRYTAPGATKVKYMSDPKARRRSSPEKFRTYEDYPCEFDYSWEPDPGSPPYIYVFGNQWYPPEKMPTVEYVVEGATTYKFMDEPKARLTKEWHWVVPHNHPIDFDRTWVPDPDDPPYIYVFGNQWYGAEEMSTIEYHTPNAVERKYMTEPKAKLLPNKENWNVPEEVNDANIDFTWIPHPKEFPYIYHFGTEYQSSMGLTYTVPGAESIKFETEIPRLVEGAPVVDVVDIFFVDRSNATAKSRFEKLQEKYPKIQKIRYVNSMLETVQRCLARATTKRFWVISSENVYDDFDFAWHPQSWQNYMTHVFGSQWQKWSNTFLFSKWEVERHIKWAKSLDEFPNLNFVDNQQVVVPSDAADVYYIDWNNGVTPPDNVKTTRFFGSYLETLKRICKNAQDKDWIWVTSSVCDYNRFDFSWYPEPWQADMLHVFPSNEQKFGDTFYLHVQTFLEHSADIELLDWFPKINFCDDQKVRRLPPKEIVYNSDTAVEAVKNTAFKEPYAVFKHFQSITANLPTPNLWSEEYRTIIPVTRGGGITLVPREAGAEIDSQLYDYPYIEVGNEKQADRPMDVIFISNGETNAERNWERLKSLVPRAKRIDGVNGRTAAYKAALTASDTPWALCVFAKLYVDESFDWSWQPDRLQAPKHYIFYARNPVNSLEYGHMAMIAYNKDLILNTRQEDIVLDYTLAAEHEVVPMLSGVAEYNDDPKMTWRTAFREVVKLKYDQLQQSNWETDMRLDAWLNIGEGKNGSWSTQGARDAVEYFNSVNGELNKLQLSFDWAWLDQLWNNQGYK